MSLVEMADSCRAENLAIFDYGSAMLAGGEKMYDYFFAMVVLFLFREIFRVLGNWMFRLGLCVCLKIVFVKIFRCKCRIKVK